MADAILAYLRDSLPEEIASLTAPYLERLERGEYESLLQDPEAQALLGHTDESGSVSARTEETGSWSDYLFQRLGSLLADRSVPALQQQVVYFCIGYAGLLAFLQSTVTGPPLAFESSKLLLPKHVAEDKDKTKALRKELLEGLTTDGIAAYKLTPNIELLSLAEAIMTTPAILKNVNAARWAKTRVAFVQQRLLSEPSPTMQELIYDDLRWLEPSILTTNDGDNTSTGIQEEFLLERATIHTHHGMDKLARADLLEAKRLRGFQYKLTGLLGKRTKFQQDDLSQMVVLAKSSEDHSKSGPIVSDQSFTSKLNGRGPTTVNLDDDTLLESISFSQKPDELQDAMDETLSPGLTALDPADQPQLHPFDSAILLSLASSITNTSPQDGLTREETLPYATRVLDGGSSNWQVYTQALLIRSRIEGYKSRTTERGLLQLQALVDQVIAETTGSPNASEGTQAATFLPKTSDGESAPASDRLRYIFQLASPSRWDLETELAARWIQLGGLRSALDIYERLELWAEAALCWAATEREDRAKKILRKQLFHATNNTTKEAEADAETADDEQWNGPARDPAPSDAPRLYCILGDINASPEMYEKAWEVSNQRYARAQRSLGRYYIATRDFVKAADSYAKSLKANQLNESSWFALGCALLELTQFEKAIEAFSRCVQLDETNAEAWSNLAAALLRKEPDRPASKSRAETLNADDEDGSVSTPSTKDISSEVEKNRQDALKALKRAASLKQDSYQIWQNVLIVAASTSPPDYQSLLTAQQKIIDLQGSKTGEACLDVEILDGLVRHVISLSDRFDPAQPGLQRIVVKFVDENVVPLITSSAPLWQMVSRLALWRNKPTSALDAEEKAWRVVTSQPGWETESEQRWDAVVEATIRLCDSYESLGERERTEGMGAGEMVAKDWRFKARSAVRGILGRGKASWEGTSGWTRLQDVTSSLKA